MKNVLLITTMYPTPDSDAHTPVCHYFAKEWYKMGYNVKVIHFKSVFPIVFYWLASIFKKFAIKVVGNDNIDTKRRAKDISFIKDNIPITSIPLFKFMPHGKYLRNTISKQIIKIQRIIEVDDFIPDAIIGHFYNPQIEIVSKLKRIYPNARTCIVLHEKAVVLKKLYSKKIYEYMNHIDLWGFRSESLRRGFENIYGSNESNFINYSGVPNAYITQNIHRDFSNKIQTFIYVGQLIERKYPASIIYALNKAFPRKQYHITYIGNGSKHLEILSATQLFNSSSNVTLLGKISRKQIIPYYDESDCFIMISKDEAFGLVYIEAMARGCITIGARNEGIDGIIKHGINGFLCEAGNIDELAETIKYINLLPAEELRNISHSAIETAKTMTNYKVAEKYINTVLPHY